jgi:glycosyltransferase involved in cell wall biosynthesis
LKHIDVLCKDNYDLVYGNHYGGTFWASLGKLKGLPLIYDMHGSPTEEYRLINCSNTNPYSLINFFVVISTEQAAINFSDKIACVSKKMMAYLKTQKKVPLQKTCYVPNGVDLNFFKQADDEEVIALKRQLGIEDRFIFGYIGEQQKWQGIENFVSAAKRIDDKKTAFLVVGVKQKQIQKIGNLLLIPRVNHKKIPLYSSICDVLVLPRPSHPATEMAAPTKFAEYTAMKKPILTTMVGDAADLVAQYNCGIVIKNNTASNLLSGIGQFSQKSASGLEEMGKNSRKLAETEFDWKKIKLNLSNAIES